MKNELTPVFFAITPDELWEKIREIVRSEVERAKNAPAQPVHHTVAGLTEKPLYKIHDVVHLFGVSRQTITEWVKDGTLVAYKVKSRVYFLRSDLEKLVTANGIAK